MAVTHMAPGKIQAILYFRDKNGKIMLLPSDEETKRFKGAMREFGYELYAAETLAEARKLQKEMQEQLYVEQQHELQKDEQMTAVRRQQIRDRLVARRNSSACDKVERDFIDMWLVIREQKHEVFKKRFTSQIGHFDALEFDNPSQHIADLHDQVK